MSKIIEVPILSIVTVTFNDIEGLRKTVDSVKGLISSHVEYWVVDSNSSDGTNSFLEHENQQWINSLIEADRGLYDAMNKSLVKVKGDFVIFINAGDILSQQFSWINFFQSANAEGIDTVLIGQTIERYKTSRYLRPGKRRESLAFTAPHHQATFYPRCFFSTEKFSLEHPISADGKYTGHAIRQCSAIFIPQVVSEFSLGGLSSNYGTFRSVKLRLREVSSFKDAQKLLFKIFLWHILPRDLFYSVLAKGKYTKLS